MKKNQSYEGAFEKEGLILSLAECSEKDLGLLLEAERICFSADPWGEGIFRDSLSNPLCKIYTLTDMQLTKIVAYCVMYYCYDEADLANIAVLPDNRGAGIGGRLLDIILEEARDNGVLSIFLEVRESNFAARSLYLSRGFEEIGKRKKYYKNPSEDAVVMVRKEEAL